MRLKDLMKQSGGTTGNLFNLPVDLCDNSPDNVRFDTPELRAWVRTIADDMKANGYDRTQPVTFREVGGRFVMENGNIRLLAVRVAIAEGAPIKTIPALPEPEGTKPEERIVRMATRNTSLPHIAGEYAEIIKKLQSFGWSDTEIASRLLKSRQWMHNILTAAGAPVEIQAAIASGAVSQTQAVKLIRSEGAEGAAAAIAKAQADTGKAKVTAKHMRAAAVASQPAARRVAATPAVTVAGAVSGDLAAAVRTFLAAWDGNADYMPAIEALRGMV